MITVSSNIGQVASRLTSKLREFQGGIKDKVLRTVASDTLAKVKVRIHQDGKNADDSQIGTYSIPYLKYRQKKPFNNTSDSKIIISLTRKLQNDFVIIPTEKGYGLGWLSNEKRSAPKKTSKRKSKGRKSQPPTNFELAKILDDKYNLYKLTSNERQNIPPVAEQAVKGELSRLSLL